MFLRYPNDNLLRLIIALHRLGLVLQPYKTFSLNNVYCNLQLIPSSIYNEISIIQQNVIIISQSISNANDLLIWLYFCWGLYHRFSHINFIILLSLHTMIQWVDAKSYAYNIIVILRWRQLPLDSITFCFFKIIVKLNSIVLNSIEMKRYVILFLS